ncbi:MAG: pyrroline-5-carboxylate reductase [Syntrophotaleaceae bacterium]
MTPISKIGFLGGGNMGEALIKGLTREGVVPAENILVAEPVESRRNVLKEKYGVRTESEASAVVGRCDLVVLAIKPQIVGQVLPQVANVFNDAKLLISIAAGVTTEILEKHFSGSPRIVRAMPNTPALVAGGATALCPGRFASPDDLDAARRLFEPVGMVRVVAEEQMDAVTGLSGSGPAYVYTVIEAMAAGGILEGLPQDAALALAAQTVLGAARMVIESGEHPAVLRDKVCSPGGTTIAGMKALEENGLRSALMSAVSNAARRSRELGKK